MGDQIKHECGFALIRLLKPLSYYHEKYGSALYGVDQLRLLLQKQRNRGQDGAGMATIKLDTQPGTKYLPQIGRYRICKNIFRWDRQQRYYSKYYGPWLPYDSGTWKGYS